MTSPNTQSAAERGGIAALCRGARRLTERSGPRGHVRHAQGPIDLDGSDGGQVIDEPLIAQIPEYQPLGGGPERHQGDDGASIDGDRQRPLDRQLQRPRRTLFVDGGDLTQRRGGGGTESRCPRHERQCSAGRTQDKGADVVGLHGGDVQ
jgi:hypothetical protein